MKPILLVATLLSAALAAVAVFAAPPPNQPKAARIIVPKIVLKEAPVQTAVRFLMAKSRELDPDKTGISIVLTGAEGTTTRVSLDLANISIAEAAKKLAEAADLEMRMAGENIVLNTKRPASPVPATRPAQPARQIPGLEPASK
ncbi:MAG: hypothetical protein M3463_21515 [Verrucomicrobiota bacterium]|nr:hypothetical protein [Verrucomicrobiota bacterium]